MRKLLRWFWMFTSALGVTDGIELAAPLTVCGAGWSCPVNGSIVDSIGIYTGVLSGQAFKSDNVCEDGVYYQVTIEVFSVSAGGIRAFIVGGTEGESISSPGIYSFIGIQNSGISRGVNIRALGTTTATWGNPSIQKTIDQ